MSPPPASVTESALRVRKGGQKDTAREERSHNRSQGRTGCNKPTADPTKKGLASLPPLPTPHSCWPTQANRGPWGWSLTTCALHFRVYTPPLHKSFYSSQWRLQTKLYTAKKKARSELDLLGRKWKATESSHFRAEAQLCITSRYSHGAGSFLQDGTHSVSQ